MVHDMPPAVEDAQRRQLGAQLGRQLAQGEFHAGEEALLAVVGEPPVQVGHDLANIGRGVVEPSPGAQLTGDQHQAAGVTPQRLHQILDLLAALQVGARARDPTAFAQHLAHQLKCLALRESADIELTAPVVERHGQRRPRGEDQ